MPKYRKMVISPSLDREIEQKREKIQGNPDFYLVRAQRIKADLRNICDIYSFWLENPGLRKKILQGREERTPAELRQEARQGIKQIKFAWAYLNSIGKTGNFIAEISPRIILRVGGLVEPFKNKEGFRTGRVSLGLNYTPPNPLRVSQYVQEFCDSVAKRTDSSVEIAAYTHLTLAGIQPFNDGNKRTARLMQDRILEDFGLPPATIPAGEREVYIDLLEQALIGARDEKPNKQRAFFDYVGGKVNAALDEILADLRVH